ncbi:MAG: hypothetical protein M1837_007544 [Sclerophora amabilis]|nr:MAG: hypothetical protein M1837_007544 [Sclerophora amabilis]
MSSPEGFDMSKLLGKDLLDAEAQAGEPVEDNNLSVTDTTSTSATGNDAKFTEGTITPPTDYAQYSKTTKASSKISLRTSSATIISFFLSTHAVLIDESAGTRFIKAEEDPEVASSAELASHEKVSGKAGGAAKKSAPSKRGGKNILKTEEGSMPGTVPTTPKLKRGSPKSKKGSKGGTNGNEPVTPQSNKRGLAATEENDVEAVGANGEFSTRHKRRAPATPTSKGRKLARSYEDAAEEDKMLWNYRQEGKNWGEIRLAWKDITGEDVGNSTLPNRFERLRANFSKVTPADEPIFLKVKQMVDAKYDLEKWARIAEILESEYGLTKYPAKSLEKAFKDISKRHAAPVDRTPDASE